MKSIKITLNDLFKFLDADNTEINKFVNSKYEIFVKTPDNSLVPILGTIRKLDEKIKVITKNTSFICGKNHILIDEFNKEVFAKDCNSFKTIDGIEQVLTKEYVEYGLVYDIAVPDPHLYVTPNGVIHHNTTAARAIAAELGADLLFINASLDGNIDTLRTTITQFVTSVSFSESKKVVLCDEADFLNANSTQPALRGFIEQFSSNCIFILTCNYPSRLIAPLLSRLTVVEFKFSKEEKQPGAIGMLKRCLNILDQENITYDKKAVASVVSTNFPDFRKTLVQLQRYSTSGTIDSGIVVQEDSNIDELLSYVKTKDFTKCRTWVANNSLDPSSFYRGFYDKIFSLLVPQTIPQTILFINQYQYEAVSSIDPEINQMAFLIQVMTTAQFK